jgi:hypothetical protein
VLAGAFVGLALAWALTLAWLERALVRAWWTGRRGDAVAEAA